MNAGRRLVVRPPGSRSPKGRPPSRNGGGLQNESLSGSLGFVNSQIAPPYFQATPAIFARGHIPDDREYQIMFGRLNDAGQDGFQGTERDVAGQLVAEYERRSAL